MSAAMIYITAGSRDEAEKLAEMLVESRLAACANIIDGMNSVFWWDGKLDHARETVLIAKTRQSLVDRLTQAVLDHHGYDCPCVVALPIFGGNPEYLAWIEKETREAD